MIAHDPLYLHHFDRVIEMSQGRIVADVSGTEDISIFQKRIVNELISGIR